MPRIFTSPYLVNHSDAHAHRPVLEPLCLPTFPTPRPLSEDFAAPTTPKLTKVKPRPIYSAVVERNLGTTGEVQPYRMDTFEDTFQASQEDKNTVEATSGEARFGGDGAVDSRGGYKAPQETPTSATTRVATVPDRQRAASMAPPHRNWSKLGSKTNVEDELPSKDIMERLLGMKTKNTKRGKRRG